MTAPCVIVPLSCAKCGHIFAPSERAEAVLMEAGWMHEGCAWVTCGRPPRLSGRDMAAGLVVGLLLLGIYILAGGNWSCSPPG